MAEKAIEIAKKASANMNKDAGKVADPKED
jgi:hypothetical protein